MILAAVPWAVYFASMFACVILIGVLVGLLVSSNSSRVDEVRKAYIHTTGKIEDFADRTIRQQNETINALEANYARNLDQIVAAINATLDAAANAVKPWQGGSEEGGRIIDPPDETYPAPMGEAVDWTDHIPDMPHEDFATLRPGESPIPGVRFDPPNLAGELYGQ